MLAKLVLSTAYCVASTQDVASTCTQVLDDSVVSTQELDDSSLLQSFAFDHKRQADPESLLHSVQRVADSFKRGAAARMTPDKVEAKLAGAHSALAMLPIIQAGHARGQKLVDLRFKEIEHCHEDTQYGEGVMAMHAKRATKALSARDECDEAQVNALEKETRECGSIFTDQQRHRCRMATIKREDHAKLCEAKADAYNQMSCMHYLSCAALDQCQKSKIETYNTVLADETKGLAAQQQEYQRMVRMQCLVQLINTASQTGEFIDEESITSCHDVKVADLSVTPPGPVPAIVECPALQSGGPACDDSAWNAHGVAQVDV